MRPKRDRIFSYSVDDSYARRYNERSYARHSDRIRGRVLDLRAKRDNESYFRSLSNRIESYVALDVSPFGTVDVIGDGRRLPFKEATFDSVIMSEVIEHIPLEDIATVLTEVRRVLKSGGYLLANVPFVYPIHGERDFHRPTYHGLEHMLTTCGFDYEIRLGSSYADVLLQVIEKPIRKVSDKLPTDALLYAFSVVHYTVMLLSPIPAAILRCMYGRNPIGDNWYVT